MKLDDKALQTLRDAVYERHGRLRGHLGKELAVAMTAHAKSLRKEGGQ